MALRLSQSSVQITFFCFLRGVHREIKKAFRALSISLHPDKPGGDAAEFARLGSAYEVLSDPDQRALYDKSAGYAQDAKLYSEEASVVNSMDAQQFKAKDARATHIVDF